MNDTTTNAKLPPGRQSNSSNSQITRVSVMADETVDFEGEALISHAAISEMVPLPQPNKDTKSEEARRKSSHSVKTTSDVNPYKFITQTDAAGNPIKAVVDSNEPTKEEPATEEMPPAAPDDIVKNDSCIACLVKYVCCINYDDFLYENYSPLLAIQAPHRVGKHTLVLDLDETLVHSSFVQVPQADFSIKVTLEGKMFEIFVIKRPGVDEFLREVGKHFEVVVFTASVPKYAMKVLEELDKENTVDFSLFREHCTLYEGNFVKDLTRLGRSLKNTIIIDNSPLCFQFQPENAIAVSTFIDNKSDRELFYIKEFLLTLVEEDDVRNKLKDFEEFIQKRIAEDYPHLIYLNQQQQQQQQQQHNESNNDISENGSYMNGAEIKENEGSISLVNDKSKELENNRKSLRDDEVESDENEDEEEITVSVTITRHKSKSKDENSEKEVKDQSL